MSADDWIKLAPSLVTLSLGVLGLVVLPSLRPSRTLRRDLVDDASWVDKLPRSSRAALQRDMAERTHVLVAYSRYPSLTRVEVGVATVILAGATATTLAPTVLFGTPNGNRLPAIEAAQVLLYFLAALGAARLAMVRWRDRSVKRLDYIKTHTSPDAALQHLRNFVQGYKVLQLAIVTAVFLPAFSVVVSALSRGPAFENYGADEWTGIATMAMALVPVVIFLGLTVGDRQFARRLSEAGAVWGFLTFTGLDDEDSRDIRRDVHVLAAQQVVLTRERRAARRRRDMERGRTGSP